VRIFTPAQELPMADHPTVGTAFVLAREKRFPLQGEAARVVFEEGVGPIPVELQLKGGDADLVTMKQPLPRFGPEFPDRAALAETLSLSADDLAPSLPCQVVSCGVPYLLVPLESLDAVRRARVRLDLWERSLKAFEASSLLVFSRETEQAVAAVHSRMFAPGFGIMEDPATGSAAGPLGCYLVVHGLVEAAPRAEMVSEQGYEMGRPSRLHIAVEQEGGSISSVQVGGRCVYMGGGRFDLS
jgi:trans-2,3-dihydro-3-hydroxyanthranilate isomerase